MLSNYEKQICRDYKKRMDAAKTPMGRLAVKIVEERQREAEHRADILKKYTEPVAPSLKQEPEVNPILKQYIDN